MKLLLLIGIHQPVWSFIVAHKEADKTHRWLSKPNSWTEYEPKEMSRQTTKGEREISNI
jgi:hypothetical protein